MVSYIETHSNKITDILINKLRCKSLSSFFKCYTSFVIFVKIFKKFDHVFFCRFIFSSNFKELMLKNERLHEASFPNTFLTSAYGNDFGFLCIYL